MVHHRAVVRIFGSEVAVNHLYGILLHAELQAPGCEFSMKGLKLLSQPAGTQGIELRGASYHSKPGFACVDFKALSQQMSNAVIEVLSARDSCETLNVFQGGAHLYGAERNAASGQAYELGQPGVQYAYGQEHGVRTAFLEALKAAGVIHRVEPL